VLLGSAWILLAAALAGLGLVAALAGLGLVAALAARARRRPARSAPRARPARSVPRARLARLLRVGGLSARLATSAAGARVRRLVTRGARRAAYDEARRRRDAEAVTRAMGEMKGAFMKLGQMLSFVSDAVPPEYRAALATLQAKAPPLEFPAIRAVIEEELGSPLERRFARFDPRPLASASIGQVHRARLPDGEEVAVKVQYPGVADAIRADLASASVLYRAVALFYPALDPAPVVAELRARIGEELDYRREASNQEAFRSLYAGHPFIRVPRVFASHSSARVLTSELVTGQTFAQVAAGDPALRARFAEILYRFVFGSILRFAVFNGDPHPGNYLFSRRGEVVFFDFGCIKRFPDPMMGRWRQLVLAHLAGRVHDFRELACELGFLARDSAIDAELLHDYFAYFYEPFRDDRVFTFTPEYNARSLAMVFRPDGRFAGLARRLNMPPDFVFVNRIQWGVYSLLGALGASGNWHRIHREYLLGDPPSTELGGLDRGFRTLWCHERGLDPTGFHPPGDPTAGTFAGQLA
jgi:predicted unusual protein kinase regulating ubiquinone biosynthesis (AarF/ABC1/UbiB family)